jgi:hypothetical protein
MALRILLWQRRPWRGQFEGHDVLSFLRILKNSFHFGNGN